MRRGLLIAIALSCSVATARAEDGPVEIDVVRPVPAAAAAAKPSRLDEVFKSIQTGGRSESAESDGPSRALPVGLSVVALAMMATAIGRWNRRRAERPRVEGDHAKLLDEVARATGLSRRQLRKLMPAARAAGLSSPAVAAICPSVLLRAAGEARSLSERAAWANLSRRVAGRRG